MRTAEAAEPNRDPNRRGEGMRPVSADAGPPAPSSGAPPIGTAMTASPRLDLGPDRSPINRYSPLVGRLHLPALLHLPRLPAVHQLLQRALPLAVGLLPNLGVDQILVGRPLHVAEDADGRREAGRCSICASRNA